MKKTIFKKWQDAFKAKELDSKVLPDVSMLPVQYRKSVVAQYILNVVIDVANDGWIANYTDRSQPKYELWLEVIADDKRPSGFGLSLHHVDNWNTGTCVGVRFAFKDRETAKEVFKNNKELFEDLYLPYYE